MNRLIAIVSSLVCPLLLAEAMAEPMEAPNIKEACATYSFVEAEYQSYRQPIKPIEQNKITFFDRPIASYRLIKTVRGPNVPQKIEVQYDFTDGSACIEPPDWEFKDSIMPQKGSKWLLIIQPLENGVFKTYRGNFGRIPLTSEALLLLKECQ